MKSPIRGWACAAAAAALCVAATPLGAQEGSLLRFFERDRLLGEPLSLERDAGVTWEGDLVSEWTAALRDGDRAGTGRYLASFRLGADLERLLELRGGTLFMDFRSNRGDSPADAIGTFQGITALDAPESDQISELWYGQVLGDDFARGKLGVLDANSEFAAIAAAGSFLSSSAGTSPTILGMPSWPVTAPGIELFVQPAAGLTLGAGLYDGAVAAPLASIDSTLVLPAGLFLIGEAALSWPSQRARVGSGRIAFGAWHSGADYARFDGGSASGTRGYYALLEQQLWRERPREADDEQGLSVFALYGRADENVAEAAAHYLAGATYRGPIPRRDRDELGLLVSHVDLSDAPGAGFAADETTLEAYAKVQLTGFSSVVLSAQHITNPGGDPTEAAALALGVRVEGVF